ncbi:hypothetical protein SELMODRAFT_405064 [Selaginella moellendorffii]|uniref:Uncharacterized protein n=1 Tax=Selaginella moellendorffii TaxID=88036 RepID=D8QYA1_SELML|nr:hypothetical protein SELMODRAFT_405064 [Selaginella moellendorffii]
MEAVLCADKSPNHSRESIYRFATNTSQRGAGTGTSFIWGLFIGQWREHYLRWMKPKSEIIEQRLGTKRSLELAAAGKMGRDRKAFARGGEETKEEAIKCWPFQTGRDQPFEDKEHRALTGVHWNADSNFRKKNHANCSQNHPSRGIKIDLKRRVSFGVAVVPCTGTCMYASGGTSQTAAGRPYSQEVYLTKPSSGPAAALERLRFRVQTGSPKDIQERFVVPTVTDARHKHQRCCEEETHSQPPGEGRPLANSGKAGCCQVILSTSPRFIRAGISYCQQLSGEPRLWDSTAQTATEG